jgi:hypothetical protein
VLENRNGSKMIVEIANDTDEDSIESWPQRQMKLTLGNDSYTYMGWFMQHVMLGLCIII